MVITDFNNWQTEKIGEVCIYCGNPTEDEDHIPSRNLYRSVVKNLKPIKIPSCKTCNNIKFSKDEEYFRDLITGLRYDSSLTATALFDTVISRSIRRNPKLALSMFKRMALVNLRTRNGIILGKKTVSRMESKDHKRIFNVLDKYIKGLFYHHFKQIIPKDWVIKHFWMTRPFEKHVEPSLSEMKWEIIDRNVFYYGYQFVPITFQSLWCLVFFSKPFFYSFVLDQVTANRELTTI